MSKARKATCNDCYFRQEGLCALPGERICPTFRASVQGELVPPRQAPLVLRAATPLTTHIVGRHATAAA
jgi:hypothetical protein